MGNKIIYIKLKEGCKPIEYFRNSFDERKNYYYNLSSYEVRLLRYPGLNVVMTRTASKGDNDLTNMLSPVGIQWKLVCWDARMEIG